MQYRDRGPTLILREEDYSSRLYPIATKQNIIIPYKDCSRRLKFSLDIPPRGAQGIVKTGHPQPPRRFLLFSSASDSTLTFRLGRGGLPTSSAEVHQTVFGPPRFRYLGFFGHHVFLRILLMSLRVSSFVSKCRVNYPSGERQTKQLPEKHSLKHGHVPAL